MIVYLDTSVITPLFVVDGFSPRSEALFRRQDLTMLVSDFAAAEFASVLARGVRMGDLSRDAAQAEFAAFDSWCAVNARRVDIAPADIARCEAFLRRLDLPLHAPDAIHIAMAQRLGATLATFDVKMAAAARTLGLAVAAI